MCVAHIFIGMYGHIPSGQILKDIWILYHPPPEAINCEELHSASLSKILRTFLNSYLFRLVTEIFNVLRSQLWVWSHWYHFNRNFLAHKCYQHNWLWTVTWFTVAAQHRLWISTRSPEIAWTRWRHLSAMHWAPHGCGRPSAAVWCAIPRTMGFRRKSSSSSSLLQEATWLNPNILAYLLIYFCPL